MGSHDDSHELAELSALADGSLDPTRREQVRARIAASPELDALYERERSVVALLHEARSRDRAPAALRERIDRAGSQRARARRAARRPSPINRLLGGLVATAAVVVALVLILPAGTPGAPSVSQAASLATRTATAPSPGVDPDHPGKLGTNLQNVYFPNWTDQNGWEAVGARSDRINGRPATTVFYAKNGVRVAYTIVGAPALKVPAQGKWMRGFLSLTLNGRQVVTWREHNHTCVLSAVGTSVPTRALVSLARQGER
jgi:anti-sigma factor RsiW